MKNLAGKAAVVTGGASGIGAAIVARLLEEGVDVVAVDRTAWPAPTSPDGKARCVTLQRDVTATATPDESIDLCFKSFGRFDIMVNCAGKGNAPSALETDDAILDEQINLNFRQVFRFCRSAIGRFENGGVIVSIASVSGMIADIRNAAYSGAKAGIIGFTRQMAMEYAGRNIRINAISPGPTATPAVAERLKDPKFRKQVLGLSPMQRAADPSEIAAPVVFLCSDDASFITGQTIPVDGGFSSSKFQTFE